MSCISNKLLKKLAAIIDLSLFDDMVDRKDKIISKLYMKKL